MSLEERQKSWTQGCFTHKLAPFASILQIPLKRGESPLINRCTGIRQRKHASHGACEHPFHTTCPVLPSKTPPPNKDLLADLWCIFDLEMFKLTFVNFQVWSRYLNSMFFFSFRKKTFFLQITCLSTVSASPVLFWSSDTDTCRDPLAMSE